MKASNLFVAGACISISTMSAAFPGLKSVQKELRKLAPKTAAMAEICTDFSGAWEGTCYDASGKPETDSFKIEQYQCSELRFDDERSVNIGGSDSNVSVATDHSYTNVTSYSWNDDKTELSAHITGALNILGKPTLWQMRGKGIMKLKDGNLQSSFGFQLDTNSTDVPSGGNSSTCFYKKAK